MVKKISCLFLFIIFLVFSCFFITPKSRKTGAPDQPTSKQMSTRKEKDDSTERTDYLDDNGNIAIAQDLGYATVIVSRTDHERKESYYDDQGSPTACKAGYMCVVSEYDDYGNIIHVKYLGKDGEPIKIRNGYASENREYNQKGQIITVRYYDVNGQPACFIGYGYGKLLLYNDEGMPYRTVYINAFSEPMMTRAGYAIVERKYYLTDGSENGKVESEFYFDANNAPARQQPGYYGLHKEYDKFGRESVLTYLNADGIPMIINKGYATVRKTYFDNGQVATERYFDENGDPCRLSDGHFGIKWKDGRKIYLDADGNEQLNLKTILNNHAWLIIVISVMMIFLTVLLDKKINAFIFTAYLFAIVYLTLISRSSLTTQSNIKTIQTFWRMIFDSETRAGVLKNIWLFVPLGAVLFKLYPNIKILMVSITISIIIEMIQYVTGIGYCDLSDVFCNGIGGLTGYILAGVLTDIKKQLWNKERPTQQGG